MLSNAYFLAKIRFDTAENEPAKHVQNLQKTIAKFATFAAQVTVFGMNAPLFNRFAVTHPGAPDIWVTMYTHWRSLGVWTPYSWS